MPRASVSDPYPENLHQFGDVELHMCEKPAGVLESERVHDTMQNLHRRTPENESANVVPGCMDSNTTEGFLTKKLA